MVQPLYSSAAAAGLLACGEREVMVINPLPTHDSAVSSCFHGCLAFLHRHFPPQSPPSHPLNPSLCSQQQPLPWDCSSSQPLRLPGDLWPCLGDVWLQQGLSESQEKHLTLRVKQIICGSLNGMRLTQSLLQPYIPWTGTLVPWKARRLGGGV